MLTTFFHSKKSKPRVGPPALCWTAIFAVLVFTSAIAETRLSIGHAESQFVTSAYGIASQTITITSDTTSSIKNPSDQSEITFTTANNNWHLALQESELLGNTATLQRALNNIPRFLKGTVKGSNGSWVRLTQTNVDGLLSYDGFIERDKQLYRLHRSTKTTTSNSQNSGNAARKS